MPRPRVQVLPLLVAASTALVGLVACGARSSTSLDEELTDAGCAALEQKLHEQCRSTCGVTLTSPTPQGSHGRPRSGTTSVTSTDTSQTSCVDACIEEKQKQCEASASCPCAHALTKLSGS